MAPITHTDRQEAIALGQADRTSFNAEYNTWLAEDRIDGTPDYTVYCKDRDSALHAILGGERLATTTTTLDELMAVDDMDAYGLLESEVDALVAAYEEGFGPLPK